MIGRGSPVTSDDFRNLVVKRRDSCVSFKDNQPSRDRQEALRFYRGDHFGMERFYGDSGDGRSTVVSRDTMEAIEGMLPALVRPFVAGDQVVSYEPTGPEDEDGAKQAADYDNYVFTTHNNAFRVIYDSMKDGLMFRLGVAKTVMEEEEDGPPETYDALGADELQALLAEGREIAGDIAQDPATQLYSVTIAPKKVKRYRVHIIAPDEFLYEERLACLDQATFLGQSKRIALADLIEMGIDPAKAKALKSGRPENSQEADIRFNQEDEGQWEDDDLARPVWVDECYVKADPEKSGVLCWYKVLLGGAQSTILNGPTGEKVDNHPYSAWTPIPVPHKLVGLSIHDATRDIQMNKTALQREINNALYLANRPQRAVLDGAVNMDDLLEPRVDGVVRVKQLQAIENLQSGGERVLGQSLQMIEYLDTVREARTGVTRYNQGMDANSLNKTATGMNIIATASQQRQELIARLYAEFLKDIFHKIRELVSLHAPESEYIRLRGKWVQVDPSDWKTNYDMTVSVGLGTNNKDQMLGHLMQLFGINSQIVQLQQGLDGPLLTAQNAYELLKNIQEAVGLKGNKYYTDPSEQQQGPPQPQPQQPDPSQVELQKAAMKGQTDLQVANIRGKFDVAKEAVKQGVPMGAVVPFTPPPMPAPPPNDQNMVDPNMGGELGQAG